MIGLPYYNTTSLTLTDNGEAWFYLGGITPSLHAKVLGLANNDHNGWSVAIGNVLYSSGAINGLIVGALDASSSGGTATVWKYTP